jgi:hypothetical protein
LNTLQKNQEKQHSSSKAAQKAAHFTPETPPNDPHLKAVIDARPTLPDAIRAGILAMVRVAHR